jgi:NAD(P)-dependent dehydrogenase (short-subunit alcohol dehydrogenase family)
MNVFSLESKIAPVTGGGRDVGATIAPVFSEAGAAVAVTARTASEVEGVAADIRETDGRAVAITADLYDVDQLPGIIDQTVGAFCGPSAADRSCAATDPRPRAQPRTRGRSSVRWPWRPVEEWCVER